MNTRARIPISPKLTLSTRRFIRKFYFTTIFKLTCYICQQIRRYRELPGCCPKPENTPCKCICLFLLPVSSTRFLLHNALNSSFCLLSLHGTGRKHSEDQQSEGEEAPRNQLRWKRDSTTFAKASHVITFREQRLP